MRWTAVLLLTLGAGLPQAKAQSPDTHAALRHCRGLAEAGARLACYDQLPLPPLQPAAAAALAEAPVPPKGAAVPSAPLVAAFGLPRPEDPVQAIVSHIPGLFEGWGPQELIRLANGQVWQVTDDSRAVYRLREPKVAVRRAAFGTFVLDIDGANQMPRVRRVE